MPPEAFDTEPSVGFHTDVWAAGVILQELLTGQLPFPQQMPSLVYAILQEKPEPMPADIPKSLHEIVGKALQKERKDRFTSAREMRESLEEWRRDERETIVNEDYELKKAVENFIIMCRELASNPKEIINIIKILPQITSYEKFRQVFGSPNFEGIKVLPGKGQSAEPKKRIVYLAIGAVAIFLAVIIGATNMARIFWTEPQSKDSPNQPANIQNIAEENESANKGNESNVSFNATPGFVATPTKVKKPKSSPTAKIKESPTPTLVPAANSSQTPATGESPTPKPATPTPKQSPTANRTQTTGRNTNNEEN